MIIFIKYFLGINTVSLRSTVETTFQRVSDNYQLQEGLMKITDQNVIEQLSKKNANAIEYLMDTYSKSVYFLIYRILNGYGNNQDIEDCTSCVFADAWEKCLLYNHEKGSVKSWLLTLSKYKALDYLRKLKKQNEVSIENLQQSGVENTENLVISKENMHQIIEIINKLNKKDRSIFYDRYFIQDSIENIAANYRLSRHAVENRLWRSRKFVYENFLSERSKSL